MPSIYKTPDGAVFKTPDGKLIKEPYDFGKSFQNRMGLNNYIEISNLNMSQFGTSILRMSFTENTQALTVATYFNLQNTNLDNYNVSRRRAYFGGNKNAAPNADEQNLTGTVASITALQHHVIAIELKNTSINTFYGDKLYASLTSPQTNLFSINKIWIGASRYLIGASPTNYSLPTISLNRFIYFNRALSINEYLYYLNNSLGNNPQSSIGIEIDIYCNFAEILDFSPLQNGSDMRVGCRDYSGYNRHGEIMNLPAGTLQQKLDFANANLFVPFQ